MSKKKKALLLVNVGTPDAPTPKAVRKYLFQFLNDPYVIDLPLLLRLALVNLIIVPFRVKKSTELYKRLWTKEGSPLLTNTVKLSETLSGIQKDYSVFFAMRYGNPSLKNVLNKIKEQNFEELIVFPLYPQYSSSTTETTIKKVQSFTNDWYNTKVRFIEQFYHNSSFINSFVRNINKYNLAEYDHIVFSYHGLPIRQIEKGHKQLKNIDCVCSQNCNGKVVKCYKHSCMHTTELIASKLNLSSDDYTISYQSRLSKDWLKPFTDNILRRLAEQGKKNVLVVAPAFVSDCLETTVEIGVDYKNMFTQIGGNKLTLVESLNYSNQWAESIIDIIK